KNRGNSAQEDRFDSASAEAREKGAPHPADVILTAREANPAGAASFCGGFMIRRLLFVTVASALLHAPAALAATCDSLSVLPLQNARITSVQIVAAGAFTPPAAPVVPGREGGAAGRGGRGGARGGGRGNQPSPYAMLPAFCRVQATLTPSSDSDIKI